MILKRSRSRNSTASISRCGALCLSAVASRSSNRARLGSPVRASWVACKRICSSVALRAVMSRTVTTRGGAREIGDRQLEREVVPSRRRPITSSRLWRGSAATSTAAGRPPARAPICARRCDQLAEPRADQLAAARKPKIRAAAGLPNSITPSSADGDDAVDHRVHHRPQALLAAARWRAGAAWPR